jgi:hypothetical protein
MSEHQIVAFRAIDGPVSAKDLEFMHAQSSRAEITPWSFDNEYHYGDFRGNAIEMLRRGYDIHLHYANFGIRKLLIRLPQGLPNPKAAKPYFSEDTLKFLPDKQGPGGSLCIEPFHESDDLGYLQGLDDLIDRLVPLRGEILDGDLRPLYLAHLVMSADGEHDPEESKEGPIPAGLVKLTPAQLALAEFYNLSDSFLAAAAQGSPKLPVQDDPRTHYAEWLREQSELTKVEWLTQVMSESRSPVRSEIMIAFRKCRPMPGWPTLELGRTIAELEEKADEIQRENDRKSSEKAARQRAKRLADMAADPEKVIKKTEELVKLRSTDSYRQIASLLADLRESLAGTNQQGLAEKQAKKLKESNPTLHTLTSALRKEGFVPK